MSVLRLLHVEDSPDDAALVRHALDRTPFEFTLTRVETEHEYVAQLDLEMPDAVICDYNLPEFSAERALAILRKRNLDLPFIVVSHHLGETEAVVAMQNGASDYLPKHHLERLAKAISSAVDRSHARREQVKAQDALRESESIRRGILNSLLSQIALVDGHGVILAVNTAWESFENARIADTGAIAAPGSNYLDFLRSASERGHPSALDIAEGLRAVITREKKLFSMQYQMTSGDTRWYIARVMPLEGSDDAVVISHRDVTDSMLGHIALEDANKRLRTLSKRMLAIQEEERRALSRDLHDDVGQTLGALKIGLHRLASAPAAERDPIVSECLAAAAEALDKLRQLAMDLRPAQLDQLGLKEALDWLAQRQSATSGITVTSTGARLEPRPPAAIESACYRIAQEALNNATRHSKATQVAISVESDGSLLKLVVRDDGIGFDEVAQRIRLARTGSMGLIGMEERAQLAGGRLKVRSVPGGGTTVSAIFPLLERKRDTVDAVAVAADT